MQCFTGAHSAFSSNYSSYSSSSYVHVPSSTTLTYEGIFSENYFCLNEKENKFNTNYEISNASIINPITNEREYYLSILLKSKFDGKGLREPIDIGLSIDISGSMSGSRLNFTKQSIFKFMDNLNENDNISISTFNTAFELIFPFQKNDNLIKNEEFKNKINSLKANGGTNIYEGLKGIYEELKKNYENGNKCKRIILLTDMEYRHDEKFINLCHQISEEKIYLTILGISNSFNTELVEEIAHIKGSNYYVITKVEEIEKYLVNEFNYICFPNCFDMKLEIFAPFLNVKSIIGTGMKNLKKDKIELEWNLENHKLFNDDIKQIIFFLLCYFKRKNQILPKPVIFSIVQFLQKNGIKTISEVNTSFPSSLKKIENNYYVEGGIILIKLDEKSIKNNNCINFDLKYTDAINNKTCNINSIYSFDKKNENYFSDKKIENALSLYYFSKFNRRLMKYCNDENKNKSKNEELLNDIKDSKIDNIKENVEKFLNEHFDKNENKENYEKYINNMNEIIDKTKKFVKNKKK
jgi:uncharacterized protein YegL